MCNRFIDMLRIDMSTVFEDKTGLLFIKRNLLLLLVLNTVLLVQQMPDHISMLDRALKDRLTVLQLYFCIQNTHRLDAHKRSHLTKTVTAALFNVDRSVTVCDLCAKLHFHIRLVCHQLTHLLVHFTGTARQTAGAGTD